MEAFKVSSEAFEGGWSIPPKYTCDGENIIPPLQISGVPANAKSLVLVMEDPDASMGNFVHWLKWNIPVSTTEIMEGMEPLGVSGKGSRGTLTYVGPCPPDREHRYFFKIYALDSELDLPEGSNKLEVERFMKGHILASTELMGRYNRPI